jgi:N4-gp56 family major capsid protein
MNTFKFDLQRFDTITIPLALQQQGWAKSTWKAAMNNLYFDKFTGNDANSIIQIVDDLKKTAGDKVTIPLLMKLTGDGVTGDNKLEGNEESLQYRDYSITVDQLRHAVRTHGKMEEQKTQIKMRTDAKAALSTWASEKIDNMLFSALSASPTTGRIVYAGSNTAENTIAATDVFSTDIIGKAKRIAQMANPKIRPVRVNGANHWVMVVDPYQARDLKKDEKWLNAQKDAQNRGDSNPIFTGMLGMWDGVVIHENEQVLRTATGASAAIVGHALFMGAQAGVMAVATELEWNEDDFDYGNQHGFELGRIFGVGKSQYRFDGTNLVDFATINVMTSSKAD